MKEKSRRKHKHKKGERVRFAARRIGDPIPERLRIDAEGNLSMVDGSDPAKYIRDWFKAMGVEDGESPVVIFTLKGAEQLEAEAHLARSWAS